MAGRSSGTGRFQAANRASRAGGDGRVLDVHRTVSVGVPTKLTSPTTPAQAGVHPNHRYQPEFILGPAKGRTRGPVWTERLALGWHFEILDQDISYNLDCRCTPTYVSAISSLM
jgi:hypothetical protein